MRSRPGGSCPSSETAPAAQVRLAVRRTRSASWKRCARRGTACVRRPVLRAPDVGRRRGSRQVAPRRRVSARTSTRPSPRAGASRTAPGSPTGRVVEVLTQLRPMARRRRPEHRRAPARRARRRRSLARPTSSRGHSGSSSRLVARERPLVLVFDDIQWGEEALLDLIEHVALVSSGAPILLLCMARPDLLDRRPGWRGLLELEPLPRGETERLIEARLGDVRQMR